MLKDMYCRIPDRICKELNIDDEVEAFKCFIVSHKGELFVPWASLFESWDAYAWRQSEVSEDIEDEDDEGVIFIESLSIRKFLDRKDRLKFKRMIDTVVIYHESKFDVVRGEA